MDADKKANFARLPIKWIQSGGLAVFGIGERSDGEVDRAEQNCSIAALKLFIGLCMLADYNSGEVATTYPRLITLSGLSRPLVSRALKRLVREGLLEKSDAPLRMGSMMTLSGWDDPFHGKLPKGYLYGRERYALERLQGFEFGELSLYALKVYLVLCAFRNRRNFNIATVTYRTIAAKAGVPLHKISKVLNRLYAQDLIAYKQADYYEQNSSLGDRTNRYLVRGLGDSWPAFNPDMVPKRPKVPSREEIFAANKFAQG